MCKKYILASDLDGTLIPKTLHSSSKALSETFSNLVEQNPHLSLAYVTGRHLELAISGVKGAKIPEPNFYICDVGTSIYFKKNREWLRDKSYDELMKAKWNDLGVDNILTLLDDLKSLKPQEKFRQGIFKASFTFTASEMNDSLLEAISERLKTSQIQADLITSVDEIGLLDILPSGFSKNSAISHLIDTYDYRRDDVVYAGDSGNDLAVFLGDLNCILVRNTPQHIVDCVSAKRDESDYYIANKTCIEGVIEGCKQFGLFPSD